MRPLLIHLLLLILLPLNALSSSSHGIYVYGGLKYPANFSHFDYLNPNAPKGGTAKIAALGTYDNLNPFIIKGVAASDVSLLFDTLMQQSVDEISSAYGLIATRATVARDGSHVIFYLHPTAKFHDGSNITAEDVAFSFDTIKTKGHPAYAAHFKDISKATVLNRHSIRFDFSDAKNRELPLTISQLPILSKAYYQKHDFEKTTLTPPLGSGPYRVKAVDAGRSITYERNPDYWAKDLPVNRGRYNFDLIHVDYYRDATVAIEALKAGEYDFRRENISKNWKKAYNIPQITDGRMIKEEIPDGVPTGMQSFVFNLRRPDFQNPRIREAISLAYDFEWANAQLFHGAYSRNTSFFGNSIFASSGLPNKAERAILTPWKKDIPARIFTTAYAPPKNDGSGNARTNLLKAQKILEEEGWVLRNMQRINPTTNQPVEIEFLLVSPSFERVVAPFIRNLKKLGITGHIRTVDSTQYIKRFQSFDFDMMVHWFTQGPYPGNELINYWHSSTAEVVGSQNIAGVKNPAVDALVERVLNAKDLNELTTASHALDRVLLWNFYVIPQWFSRSHRVIYWNKFSRPAITPPYALGFLDSWWVDEEKEKKLNVPQELD